MTKMIRDKAKAAGLPTQSGEDEFANHFGDIKVDLDKVETEEERRAAKVKNISLRLLGVDSP